MGPSSSERGVDSKPPDGACSPLRGAAAEAATSASLREAFEPRRVLTKSSLSANTKKGPQRGPFFVLAEREGFEPSMGY